MIAKPPGWRTVSDDEGFARPAQQIDHAVGLRVRKAAGEALVDTIHVRKSTIATKVARNQASLITSHHQLRVEFKSSSGPVLAWNDRRCTR